MSTETTIPQIEACLEKAVNDMDCRRILFEEETKSLLDQEQAALQIEFDKIVAQREARGIEKEKIIQDAQEGRITSEKGEITHEVIQVQQSVLSAIQTTYEQLGQDIGQKNDQITSLEGDLSQTQTELDQMAECSWRASPPGNYYTDENCVKKKEHLKLAIQNQQDTLYQVRNSLQQQTLEREEQHQKKVALEGQILDMQYENSAQSLSHIKAIQDHLITQRMQIEQQQMEERALSIASELLDEELNNEETATTQEAHYDYHYEL